MGSFKTIAETVVQLPQFDSTSLLLLRNLISSWQFVEPITKDDRPFCVGLRNKRIVRRLPAIGQEEEKKDVLVSETRLSLKRESEADGEEEEVRAIKIKKVRVVPVEVRHNIETRGGNAIKLVIEKKLTSSDLEKGQNRLLMPKSKVDNSFLEGEEKSKVMDGVHVKLLEPCGVVSDMKLKIWKMRSNRNYVLIASSKEVTWNKVARREENLELGVFEAGNDIRVWSFRVEGQLWLTFEKVAATAGGDDGANNDSRDGGESSTSYNPTMIRVSF